jgi:hypothetical protein
MIFVAIDGGFGYFCDKRRGIETANRYTYSKEDFAAFVRLPLQRRRDA